MLRLPLRYLPLPKMGRKENAMKSISKTTKAVLGGGSSFWDFHLDPPSNGAGNLLSTALGHGCLVAWRRQHG